MTMTMTDEAAYAALAASGAAPVWAHHGDAFLPEPRTSAVPFAWRYAELRELMMHFTKSKAITIEEGGHRVLMLANPGLIEPAALTTLFGGLEGMLPGEVAPGHRHTSNAFRFIVEGAGAYTTVEGERVSMRVGDLLMTPSWAWHDHKHEGTEPMFWLNGLDYPLVNLLECGFYEPYEGTSQPFTVPPDRSSRLFIHGRLNPTWETRQASSTPVGNYPWTETEAAFRGIADDARGSEADGILLEYTNPWDGGPVTPVMGCRISRLRPGFHGTPRRTTANTVYHVVRGSGRTVVGDTELSWGEKDFFAVPGWSFYQHHNDSPAGEVILFSYTDEPAKRALGLLREELGR